MDTSKARRAALAVNRRLPPDAVLMREYFAEGLSMTEIARRHGASPDAVYRMFAARGWSRGRKTAPAPADHPPPLRETSAKIVTYRDVMIEGREFMLRRMAISLPRIPTLHGHFEGA